jgi:hypothetical protein
VQLTDTPGASGGCMNTVDNQSVGGFKTFSTLLAIGADANFDLGSSTATTTLSGLLNPNDSKSVPMMGTRYIPILNGSAPSYFVAVFDVFACSSEAWFSGARLKVFYAQVTREGTGATVQRGPRTTIEQLFGPVPISFGVGAVLTESGTAYGLTANVSFQSLRPATIAYYISSTITTLPVLPATD